MATALALALQVSANTQGLEDGLGGADKTLKRFSRQLNYAGKTFDRFSDTAGELPKEMERVTKDVQSLGEQFRSGAISADQFEEQFKGLRQEANDIAAAFREGQAVSEQYMSTEERVAREQERLNKLLDKGAISQATYDRATQKNNAALGKQATKLDEIKSKFGRAGAEAGKLPGILGSVTSAVMSATTPWEALAVAGVAVAGAIGTSLVKLEDHVEELDRQARKLGTSFDFMQSLQVAATESGQSLQALTSANTRLLRSLDEARNGSAKYAEQFERIGLSQEDLANMSSEEIFNATAAGISNISDEAEKAAVASQLFGRRGAELLDTLAGFGAIDAKLERLSARFTELERADLASLGTSLDEVGVATSGLVKNLTTPFTKAFDLMADGFSEFVAGFGNAGGEILDILSPAFTAFGALVGGTLAGLGTALNLVAKGLEPLAIVGRTLSQIIGGLAKRFIDFTEYLNSGIVVLEEMIVDFAEFTGIADVVRAAFDYIGGAIAKFAEWLGVSFDETENQTAAIGRMDDATKKLGDSATQYYDEIDNAISRVTDLGKAGFDAAVKYQEKLQEIADLQAEGEYSQEEAARAAEQATAAFDAQVSAMEERNRLQQEALDADRKIVDALLEQQRIEDEFGGDSSRAQAAEAVLAIQRQIARVEGDIAAARASGDAAGIAASAAKLATLDQLAAQQERIASGAVAAEEAAQEAQDKRLAAAIKNAEKVNNLRLKYSERQAELDAARLEEIGRVSASPLKIDDVRTSAGLAEYLRIAEGREDPAVQQAEKQYRKLEEIKREIAKANAEPVEIGS